MPILVRNFHHKFLHLSFNVVYLGNNEIHYFTIIILDIENMAIEYFDLIRRLISLLKAV